MQYRPRNHITVTVPGPKESYKLNHNSTEMEQGGQKGEGMGGIADSPQNEPEAILWGKRSGVCRELTARLVRHTCKCKCTRSVSTDILSFSLPLSLEVVGGDTVLPP